MDDGERTTDLEAVPYLPEVTGEEVGIPSFREGLMLADDLRSQLTEASDWFRLCQMINVLKQLKADLDVVLHAYETDAANLLPDKKMMVDGFGVIERRTASSRKWESEKLLADLCRNILDPEGTGEIQTSQIGELMRTLKKVMPLTGSLGWRVTALKEVGVDPDQYSEVTYGRRSVQITK